MYTRGSLLGHEIADALKLPFANVVDQVLNDLRRERLMEVKGASPKRKSGRARCAICPARAKSTINAGRSSSDRSLRSPAN